MLKINLKNLKTLNSKILNALLLLAFSVCLAGCKKDEPKIQTTLIDWLHINFFVHLTLVFNIPFQRHNYLLQLFCIEKYFHNSQGLNALIRYKTIKSCLGFSSFKTLSKQEKGLYNNFNRN